MGNPVVTTNLESVSDIFGSYPFVRISNNTTEFSNNLHDMIKMEKSSESIGLSSIGVS